jgi:hypothetical protein
MSAPDVFILVNAADGSASAPGGIRIRDDSVQRYGPLAHAQFRFWFWHECCEPGRKWLLNLAQTWNVASSQGVTVVVDALRQLMARHEALRTTYGFNETHEPVQRVHQVPQLALVELGPGSATSASGASARLHSLLAERDFALDTEFPFRAGIVADGETVTVIAVFHHSVVDGQAILVMHDEFRALTEGLPVRAEADLWHPVDQAFEEQSAAGRRRGDAALARLSNVYQTIPASPVIGPPLGAEDRLHAGGPLYRLLRMDSAQALRNMRAAARILRVSPYSVLVSAYMIVLALASGDSCVAILSGYANRHLRNARHSVMCLVQDVPICLRIEPGMKCSQILRDLSQACFTGFCSGNYAVDRFEELRAAIEDERGIRLAHDASLNYVELDSQAYLRGEGNARGEPPSPAAEGIPYWEEFKDPSIYSHDMNLTVYKETAFLRFAFNICADVVSPALAKAIILALESCLAVIAGGQDPSVRELGEMLRIPAPAHRGTRREVADCVVDLAAVRSLLLQHPDVIEAGVFTTSPALTPANASPYVYAYVHAVGRLQIGELRHFIMTRLSECRLAAAPYIFIVTRSAPEDPASEKGWRLQPVACRGTGREHIAPGTRQRGPGIVGDVATRLGALRQADPGLGYLQQGGRLAMVPAIVRQLRKDGYRGLSPADFLGHWTMSELSARVTSDDLPPG